MPAGYPFGSSPFQLRLADLDGDGDLDAATVSANAITWLRNAGDGTFTLGATIPLSSSGGALAVADLDGDQDIDLAVTQAPNVVGLYLNQGGGVFVAAGTISAGLACNGIAAGDLDHDGDSDLAVTHAAANGVSVLLNQGGGVFSAPSFSLLFLFPSIIEIAEVSGDGHDDLVVLDLPAAGSGTPGVMDLSFGDGTGNVVPTGAFLTGAGPQNFVVGDVDGDGDQDIVVCETLPSGVRVHRNPGNGLFDGTFDSYSVPAPPITCTLVDADADGDLDLAVLLTNQLRVMENDGTGAFTLVANPTSANSIYSLRSGDLDGDGHPDLAAVSNASSKLVVRKNCATNGVPYCFGDGSGTACPCGNSSPASARSGCLASTGLGARLVSTGAPSLASDTVVLQGSGMPNSVALYLQGTDVESGGAGALLGDGLLCVSGALVRLGTTTNAAGVSSYPAGPQLTVSVRGAVATPGTRYYQVWYRNAAAFCTPGTFNLSNGLRLTWRP